MLEIQPLDAIIGARVTNISLDRIADASTLENLEVALERYGVLVFPDQTLSPRQQIDFSKQFGSLARTELEKARLADFQEIFVVGNVGKGLVSFAPQDESHDLEWHADHIHLKVSARASLLYAIEVPERGGDTLFACMYEAYDALPQAQKKLCCDLEMIHSTSGLDDYLTRQKLGETNSVSGRDDHEQVIRPLVRAHPLTGRLGLYFGNQITIGIVGWERDEARAFISDLTKHACRNAFQYRHQWQPGDAVLWDNRRVLHAGTPYDTEHSRRLMHRTTINEMADIERVKAV